MGLDFILDELKSLRDHALMREYRTIESAQGPYIQIEGKSYLSFCSNNYLGLADHPRIKQAAIAAINQYGWGTGASRLVAEKGDKGSHLKGDKGSHLDRLSENAASLFSSFSQKKRVNRLRW